MCFLNGPRHYDFELHCRTDLKVNQIDPMVLVPHFNLYKDVKTRHINKGMERGRTERFFIFHTAPKKTPAPAVSGMTCPVELAL